jgi:hypothetical protein
MKLKRKLVQQKYAEQIEAMYRDGAITHGREPREIARARNRSITRRLKTMKNA